MLLQSLKANFSMEREEIISSTSVSSTTVRSIIRVFKPIDFDNLALGTLGGSISQCFNFSSVIPFLRMYNRNSVGIFLSLMQIIPIDFHTEESLEIMFNWWET